MVIYQNLHNETPPPKQQPTFYLDAGQELRSADGGYFLGYQADDHGKLSSGVGRLTIPLGWDYMVRPTTRVGFEGNLDPASGQSITTFTSITSLHGWPLLLRIECTLKSTTTGSSQWKVEVRRDNFAGRLLGRGELTFDGYGRAQPGSKILVRIPRILFGPQNVELRFGDTTALENGGSELNPRSQNGLSYGVLSSYHIEPDGTLLGRYDNGVSRIVGKLVKINPFYNNHENHPRVYPDTFSSRFLIEDGPQDQVID